MKISVIVAAYNAEKYLEETLDSLIRSEERRVGKECRL